MLCIFGETVLHVVDHDVDVHVHVEFASDIVVHDVVAVNLLTRALLSLMM